MDTILVATDSIELFANVDAALGSESIKVIGVRRGQDVVRAITENDPSVVLLDLQIQNMGGIASCLAIRQEEEMGRLEKRPVALLLDRQSDEFLAGTARPDGWLVKPFDSNQLKAMVSEIVAV